MRVAVIGAGNVATQLTTQLHRLSFQIVQVYSRTLESAKILAEKVEAIPITNISDIIDNADLYIFSVKDDIIEGLLPQLEANNGLWLHTAGSIPMGIFKDYTNNYGVLYPFQTFSKNREVDWHKIPLFIEASNEQSLDKLASIANKLSNSVTELTSTDRKYLHLTGVFACNFTNHMYTLSEAILKKINLPFEAILPLIDETVAKVHSLPPAQAQTGPAVRYDKNVINSHLELIEDPKIRELYKLLSEDIHRINQPL